MNTSSWQLANDWVNAICFSLCNFFLSMSTNQNTKQVQFFSASLLNIPSHDMTLIVNKRKKKGKTTTDPPKEGRAILPQGERKHQVWSWQEHPKV